MADIGSISTAADLTRGQAGEDRVQPNQSVGTEPGLRFALREGGKTIGAGGVTKVTA